MSTNSSSKGGDLPLPVVIGVVVVVVLILGGLVWHFVFAPPSSPLDNLTTAEKRARYDKISKENAGKQTHPFESPDAKSPDSK
jgi:cytoskeletal protein RodZ